MCSRFRCLGVCGIPRFVPELVARVGVAGLRGVGAVRNDLLFIVQTVRREAVNLVLKFQTTKGR